MCVFFSTEILTRPVSQFRFLSPPFPFRLPPFVTFFLSHPPTPPPAVSSVTRFGEISTLRQNFRQLWKKLKGPLSIRQNFERTLETP